MRGQPSAGLGCFSSSSVERTNAGNQAKPRIKGEVRTVHHWPANLTGQVLGSRTHHGAKMMRQRT